MPHREAEYELQDLTIEEGSLVDKGDNPEAHVMLFKAKEEETEEPKEKIGLWKRLAQWVGKEFMPRTTEEILVQDSMREEFFKTRLAFMESVEEILALAEPGEMGPMLQKTVSEFNSRVISMTQEMSKSAPDESEQLVSILDQMAAAVSIQGEGVNETAKRAEFAEALKDLESYEPPAVDAPTEEIVSETTNTTKSFDELLNSVENEELREQLKAARDESVVDAEKSQDDDDVVADTEKEADPMANEETQKAFATLQKQNDELAQKIAKLEDEKATETFRKQAQEILGATGGDVEKLGGLLKGVNDEQRDTIKEIVSGLVKQAQLNEELYKNLGSSSNVGMADMNTAEERLQVEAAKIREANPEMSEAGAYDAAMKRFPKLAEEAVRG